MVYSAARRILNNHHDAQDVTQAVFLVLSRQAHKLRSKRSLASWLHSISKNIAMNQYKAKNRPRNRELSFEKPANSHSPENHELRHELDQAIQQLPEKYRTPIILFHLEENSLIEISKQLSLNLNTLRTHLQRGREILRQKLVKRGLEISSIATLSNFLSQEAKANAIHPLDFQKLITLDSQGRPNVSQTASDIANAPIPQPSKLVTILTGSSAIALLVVASYLIWNESHGSNSSAPQQSTPNHQFISSRSPISSTEHRQPKNSNDIITLLKEYYEASDAQDNSEIVPENIAELAYQLGRFEQEHSIEIINSIFQKSHSENNIPYLTPLTLTASALGGWASTNYDAARPFIASFLEKYGTYDIENGFEWEQIVFDRIKPEQPKVTPILTNYLVRGLREGFPSQPLEIFNLLSELDLSPQFGITPYFVKSFLSDLPPNFDYPSFDRELGKIFEGSIEEVMVPIGLIPTSYRVFITQTQQHIFFTWANNEGLDQVVHHYRNLPRIKNHKIEQRTISFLKGYDNYPDAVHDPVDWIINHLPPTNENQSNYSNFLLQRFKKINNSKSHKFHSSVTLLNLLPNSESRSKLLEKIIKIRTNSDHPHSSSPETQNLLNHLVEAADLSQRHKASLLSGLKK